MVGHRGTDTYRVFASVIPPAACGVLSELAASAHRRTTNDFSRVHLQSADAYRVGDAWGAVAAVMLVACAGCPPNVDVKSQLKVAEVTTGWSDAGIVEGSEEQLVPTVQFQLQNVSTQPVAASVQVNAVFRHVDTGEEETRVRRSPAASGPTASVQGSSTPPSCCGRRMATPASSRDPAPAAQRVQGFERSRSSPSTVPSSG